MIWQFAGDVKDWPGIDDVDLNRMPGTRTQLKAWMLDPTKPQPREGAVDPQPEPPDEEDPNIPGGKTDLTPVLQAIEGVKTTVEAIKAKQEAIFK